jgi:hypothetical protein
MQVGGNSKLLVTGLIVNGVWGLMTAAFYRVVESSSRRVSAGR